MKQIVSIMSLAILMTACQTQRQLTAAAGNDYPAADTLITQSLFNDKASTISEENIQKTLAGSYQLPQQVRIAIVKLESTSQVRKYYWNDEQYLKNQQSYLELFSEKFKQSGRVTKLSVIPDLLIPRSPSFTNIREAAVRMQADIVVIYAITSDIYSRYKFLSRADIKAFATTQLIILDVRTGLIPFSTMITKDVLSQRKKEELDHTEAVNRIQNEAVLLTIGDIGEKITAFLGAN